MRRLKRWLLVTLLIAIQGGSAGAAASQNFSTEIIILRYCFICENML
jgi:hypothetical protein